MHLTTKRLRPGKQNSAAPSREKFGRNDRQDFLLHLRQREGLRVLEMCYKKRIISSAASGEIQETNVLLKV